MAGQNDFLLWATGANANVLTQAAYSARGDRASGAVAGTASAQQANKTWRQASIIARMITQFIIDRIPTVDCIDDGTIATLEANFLAAVRSTFSIPNTGVVPGTYGPTITIAVQADGRITGLANSGLAPTGVSAGTYFGVTLTVGTDGRITAISSVAYGQIGAANTWTQPNTFVDPNAQGGVRISGPASGAAVALLGNGAVTPNKYIRAINGAFDIVNSAYSGVIFRVTDAGAVQLYNSLNVSGPIDSNGNITANNGRLRASFGAFLSGDPNAAAILNDFTSQHLAVNTAWSRRPDGLIEQSFPFTAPCGGGLFSVIANLLVIYPHDIFDASISFLGTTPPGVENPGSICVQPASPSQVLVTTNYANSGSLGCIIRSRGW